ncbi:MAG: hypothetical protein ACOX9C_01080 [Kiritimatiellia bacterium]|jgi:flagellar biosynthesis GTPase FlhF
MNKLSIQTVVVLIAVVCTGLGFAIGKFTSAPSSENVKIVEVPAPAVNAGIADQTAKIDMLAAKLAAAEARVEELAAAAEADAAETAVAAPEPAATEAPRRRETREERMARLKEENPEEHAAEVKRQEEREQRRQTFMEQRRNVENRRDDFFANVNIAYMTPEEQKDLETFVREYKEIRGIFEAGANVSREDRGRAMMLGMGLMQRVEGVRESLLKATAKEMGFNDSESVEFSKSINEIFGATSLVGPGGMNMPGMGGRGGFGGGRGR